MMPVSEQLRQMLEHTDKSKNTIIKETQIDRSSFYKILSGERHATQEQFAAILAAIGPDESTRTRLLDAYERERAGKALHRQREEVRGFLNALGQAPDTGTAIPEEVRTFVDASAGTTRYQAFLPMGSRCLTALFSLLHEQTAHDRTQRDGDAVQTALPDIYALISYTESRKDRTLRALAGWFPYLSRQAMRFHAYTLWRTTRGLEALPFPYYIVGRDAVLLISGDEQRFIMTDDPRIVAAYRTNYETQLVGAQEIGSTETGYEPILRFITGLWQTAGEDEIYLLTPRPCLWLCSDDDMVRRYLRDEQLVQYGQMYRSLNLREFTTRTGMEQFLSEGRITEAGFNIPVSPEDLAAVRARIEQNTGVRSYFLNEERIHLPQDWQVFIVAHRTAVFVPYATSTYMLTSTSSDVVEPLTEWCESRATSLNRDVE